MDYFVMTSIFILIHLFIYVSFFIQEKKSTSIGMMSERYYTCFH